MTSAPAIAFDLNPSRRIGAAAVVVGLLASAAPWLTGLPLPPRLLLSFAAVVLAGFSLHRFLRPPFRRAARHASGWTLVDRRGDEHPAILETPVRLGSVLALDFRFGTRQRFRFVVAPDNLDAETRRRLALLVARADAAPTS
ncbi:protein YgfX [Dokdonella sp.]|uniref:protein YgfX n=1 Tax=Dokdonella sp. TaxID=2291710 RepID=UPI002630C673|nr:protein YgfX [Dokdonella sp.]